MKRIAILGCGPAGLLACHAVALMGHEPTVFSIKNKSIMPGTMYVHEPIEGVTKATPDGILRYIKRGTRDGYAEKVYGSPRAGCSWDEFQEGAVPAWSMYDAYERLWAEYSTEIRDVELDGQTIDLIRDSYQFLISSVPAPLLCHDGHQFHRQPIWVKPEAVAGLGNNEVVYNGEAEPPWYRSSYIFGHGATEYAQETPGAMPGIKPLRTDCDCRGGIFRVGRFGRWRKGELVHHAFQRTISFLRDPNWGEFHAL